MHGAGNDYIYVDATQCHIPDPGAAAAMWSHRHFGIGGDGLVLIGRPDAEVADFSMRLFNADGSEAAMCGNASRCVGKLVYEMGLTRKQQLRLLTPSGVKLLNIEVDAQGHVAGVTVDMLAPIFADERQFAATGEPLPAGILCRWAIRCMSSLSTTSRRSMWRPAERAWSSIRVSPSGAT